VTHAVVDEQSAPAVPESTVARSRAHTRLVAAACFVVLAVPLLVAMAVLHGKDWRPTLDLAWTELRVRDVGTRHTPLIGLVGRIGPSGPNQGSHPGPLSFYALAPFYRAYGASSWALEAAAATLNLLATGIALWIATRRGGIRLVLAVAAMLALVLHFYGPSILTQAWNPYMPPMWWMVFLLACWSVLCDDFVMLPIAVVAGSFCMQTHVPYVGPVAGVGAVTIALTAFSVVRRRGDDALVKRLVTWGIGAVVVLVVVWLPPVIDQLRHSPGNISTLLDYFQHPPESPVGVRRGVEELLAQVNPVKILTDVFLKPQGGQVIKTKNTSPWWPGALLIAAWIGSVVVAYRLRIRRLLALDVVIGSALAFGAIAASRIFGLVWFYLVMWAWVVSGLMLLALVWAAAAALERVVPRDRLASARTAGAVGLVAVTVVFTARFVVDASRVDVPDPTLSAVLAKIVPQTAAALRASDSGPDAPYLVTWTDPATIGAPGYGLVNELDRLGFDVGVLEYAGPGATRHRVRDPADAAAEVHLSVGSDIQLWRARPDVREIAHFDPRSPAERERYERLHARILSSLRARGLDDLAAGVDGNGFGTAIDQRLTARERAWLTRLLNMGLPESVFVTETNVDGTTR